ncbi:MAG: histidine phosphatase family protein [Planctomycetes bacterium]|nr:histidine phosphatase family protein [Planctomycetota bacterium]
MMDYPTIYLVRHGVTKSNKAKIYMGASKEGLDADGVRQAKALGMKLASKCISTIYTSPIARAKQTARLISARLHTKIIIEKDLREMGLGIWQGMSELAIARQFPKEFALWNTRPAELRMPGRETISRVQNRAVKLIRKLARAHPGGKIIALTHVAIIRCLILYFTHRHLNDYKKIDVPNTSVFELKLYGNGKSGIRKRVII